MRVQLSEGLTAPCDSGNNRMLFDGRLAAGTTFRTAIAGDCVCVRSTSASFPNSDWSTPRLQVPPEDLPRERVLPPRAGPDDLPVRRRDAVG